MIGGDSAASTFWSKPTMDGINEDPESALNLSQSNNLVFYISRNHSLATKVDDVTSLCPEDSLLSVQEGRTVLHWVCALGDLPKANAVLSIPGVDVNLQDGAGWTSLMIAGTPFLVESGWGNSSVCGERRYRGSTFRNT